MSKLNWTHEGNLLVYKWRIMTPPVSYFFKRYQLFSPIYKWYINIVLSFYKKSSVFPNPNINETYFGILRNEEYYNYKEYKKKYIIEIDGLKIWLSVDGALKIGDMYKKRDFDFHLFIKKIKKLAFFLGTNKMVMQYSPCSCWIKILDKYKTPETGLPIIYKDLTHIYNPQNFVFSYGDIDTF
jgi:hypothetical protein